MNDKCEAPQGLPRRAASAGRILAAAWKSLIYGRALSTGSPIDWQTSAKLVSIDVCEVCTSMGLPVDGLLVIKRIFDFVLSSLPSGGFRGGTGRPSPFEISCCGAAPARIRGYDFDLMFMLALSAARMGLPVNGVWRGLPIDGAARRWGRP